MYSANTLINILRPDRTSLQCELNFWQTFYWTYITNTLINILRPVRTSLQCELHIWTYITNVKLK
ncbi:unnamed protein product [Clavelina lepadiformis]|uniref:Uncharacterized protein n=1 Tax=Clavelina lepadiformis TaxID=159417 RepID=A0ABP0FCD7_CLALP